VERSGAISKARESTDRIDRSILHRHKSPANRHIPMRSISGRYLWERSVTISWRSITHSNTARKKVLQTGALRAVRAMRSVFIRALSTQVA
jgi:hypothetical protein